MRLVALSILGLLVLTGCSELQVIGRATVRELSADAISVDKQRYQPRAAKEPKKDGGKAMVAQAGLSPAKGQVTQVAATKELWRR